MDISTQQIIAMSILGLLSLAFSIYISDRKNKSQAIAKAVPNSVEVADTITYTNTENGAEETASYTLVCTPNKEIARTYITLEQKKRSPTVGITNKFMLHYSAVFNVVAYRNYIKYKVESALKCIKQKGKGKGKIYATSATLEDTLLYLYIKKAKVTDHVTQIAIH